MCRPATCPACSKATWKGCGQHVDQVMRGVPKNERCRCTPAQRAAAQPPSLMARIFGRG